MDGRSPDAPDRAARRPVRHLGGGEQVQPAAERDAERGEDRVPGARDVEDLARARRDPARLLPAPEEEHPLLGQLDEKRLEAELVPELLPEPRHGRQVARRLARHGLELAAVRRHDRGAAVTGVVPALRVHERRDPLRVRGLEKGGHHGGGQRPLRVVRDEKDVRGGDRGPGGLDERGLGARGKARGQLLVDAQHLAPVRDHASLDGRRAALVHDDRSGGSGERRQPPGEPRALLARTDRAERHDPRSQRREVLDDVARSARAPAHGRQREERHGRLGRDALDAADPRLVEHEVTRDGDRDAGRGRGENGDFPGCHGGFLRRSWSSASAREGASIAPGARRGPPRGARARVPSGRGPAPRRARGPRRRRPTCRRGRPSAAPRGRAPRARACGEASRACGTGSGSRAPARRRRGNAGTRGRRRRARRGPRAAGRPPRSRHRPRRASGRRARGPTRSSR